MADPICRSLQFILAVDGISEKTSRSILRINLLSEQLYFGSFKFGFSFVTWNTCHLYYKINSFNHLKELPLSQQFYSPDKNSV